MVENPDEAQIFKYVSGFMKLDAEQELQRWVNRQIAPTDYTIENFESRLLHTFFFEPNFCDLFAAFCDLFATFAAHRKLTKLSQNVQKVTHF